MATFLFALVIQLASALRKLQRGVEEIPMQANPATAHMFIVSPLTHQGLINLFSTHRPLEDRVARLGTIAMKRIHRVSRAI